jgi:hypothetical protein
MFSKRIKRGISLLNYSERGPGGCGVVGGGKDIVSSMGGRWIY